MTTDSEASPSFLPDSRSPDLLAPHCGLIIVIHCEGLFEVPLHTSRIMSVERQCQIRSRFQSPCLNCTMPQTYARLPVQSGSCARLKDSLQPKRTAHSHSSFTDTVYKTCIVRCSNKPANEAAKPQSALCMQSLSRKSQHMRCRTSNTRRSPRSRLQGPGACSACEAGLAHAGVCNARMKHAV